MLFRNPVSNFDMKVESHETLKFQDFTGETQLEQSTGME